MKGPRRLIALDLLRAIAIVLVLGRHVAPLDSVLPDALHQISIRLGRCGWMGVDLFFVLSGFLVSGLLFQEYQRYGKIRPFRFLIRRGFKIYPPFYILIATIVYVQWSNGNYDRATWPQIRAEAFFFQNYSPGLINHTWSLAVEEHFYLMLPILLLVLISIEKGKANPFRHLPTICIVVTIAATAARIATHALREYSDLHNIFPTHLRVDSLLAGVLLSYYYHFYPEQTLGFARRNRWRLIGVATLLLLPVYSLYPYDNFVHTYGFAYAYVAFDIILLVSLTLKLPHQGLASWPLRIVAFCGTYSYGIYLWHMPMKDWGAMYLTRWFGWQISPGENLTIFVFGSIIVGIVFSMIVEVPALALRDWLFPSRSGAVEPSMLDGATAPAPAAILLQLAPITPPPTTDKPA